MKRTLKISRGFSVLETLIVITIMLIILAIATYSFSTARARKQLDVAIDSIASKLEEAKAYSLSGKNGTNFGVAVSSTTYTLFSGSSYSSSDANNITWTLPDTLSLSKSLSGGYSYILFARITGAPQATGTLTLTHMGKASTTAYISIGTSGEISVIK